MKTGATIDRRARTQPVALHQDYGMHKEVEIDDLFKSRGKISMTDGNESEQVQKKSLCSECGQEFEAFNQLWVHIQSVHQNGHKCKDCGKT